MLKIYEVTCEIWDGHTNEMLVDGLTFDQAAEQCAVYQEFFGNNIFVAFRESARVIAHTTPAQEYKKAWLDYFDEIRILGNLN